ncbi:hypothetical protein QIH80_12010 [Bradyrhizobium elkanii]|nr:hypothetical protein QIH80_12010 [Bradyrhizobium elkanii]
MRASCDSAKGFAVAAGAIRRAVWVRRPRAAAVLRAAFGALRRRCVAGGVTVTGGSDEAPACNGADCACATDVASGTLSAR